MHAVLVLYAHESLDQGGADGPAATLREEGVAAVAPERPDTVEKITV